MSKVKQTVRLKGLPALRAKIVMRQASKQRSKVGKRKT